MWLSDRVAVIAGGGRQPALPLRGIPARSFGMAGLELAYSPVSKSAVPVSLPHTVMVRSFETHSASNGLQKIVIRVGGVEGVEVMGDFSDWTPLTLTRRGRDLWELALPLSPGVTDATSSTTVEPDGITAPFEPVTDSLSVATILSPGWLDVQTLVPFVKANVEPEPISPRLGAGAGSWAGVGAGITGAGCWLGGGAAA